MIDLKNLITQHPQCAENPSMLKSYLMDLYPAERARTRVLVAILESGIVSELRRTGVSDALTMSNYCARLEDEYGLSEKLSQECINLWCEAFGTAKMTNTPKVVPKKQVTSVQEKHIPAGKPVSAPAPNQHEFLISNGVLVKYYGYGGNVVIPNGVTRIGDYAFFECGNLTSIVIPDGVISIGDSAFWNCKSLTSIVLPDSVTCIEDHAFEYCKRLTSIVIPDSVTSIGTGAFYECPNLTIDAPRGSCGRKYAISERIPVELGKRKT